MKVAIIGIVGVPACYGGYESLVENLLTYKEREDIEYTIYCSSKAYDNRLKTYKGAKLIYLPLNANGAQATIYDIVSLVHAYFTSDKMLVLGCFSSIILPITKLLSAKNVIINLDGLDDKREKFNSFKKKIINFGRKCAAKYAHVCISDNQGIVDYAKQVFNRDSLLIEYGGDNAKIIRNDNKLFLKYGLKRDGYCFKVARIEPENNIELILKAFANMPNEQLVIVGNWDKNDFGKNMKQIYEAYPNIKILNPIYESEEINLLRSNCKIYIHGHSAGGTNPSLVEAMNLEIPIIAYNVIYNRETTENQAYYFKSEDELKEKVKTLSLDIDLRRDIGYKMYEIAKRRYTWKIIVRKYENLF